MQYRFDQSLDRSCTNSFKWKARNLKSNGKELYPMWVADMEFEVAPAIRNRLMKRVQEGIFGYEGVFSTYSDYGCQALIVQM